MDVAVPSAVNAIFIFNTDDGVDADVNLTLPFIVGGFIFCNSNYR